MTPTETYARVVTTLFDRWRPALDCAPKPKAIHIVLRLGRDGDVRTRLSFDEVGDE